MNKNSIEHQKAKNHILLGIFIIGFILLGLIDTSTSDSPAIQISGPHQIEYDPEIIGNFWTKKITAYHQDNNTPISTYLPSNLENINLYIFLDETTILGVTNNSDYQFEVSGKENGTKMATWVVPEIGLGNEVLFSIEGDLDISHTEPEQGLIHLDRSSYYVNERIPVQINGLPNTTYELLISGPYVQSFIINTDLEGSATQDIKLNGEGNYTFSINNYSLGIRILPVPRGTLKPGESELKAVLEDQYYVGELVEIRIMSDRQINYTLKIFSPLSTIMFEFGGSVDGETSYSTTFEQPGIYIVELSYEGYVVEDAFEVIEQFPVGRTTTTLASTTIKSTTLSTTTEVVEKIKTIESILPEDAFELEIKSNGKLIRKGMIEQQGPEKANILNKTQRMAEVGKPVEWEVEIEENDTSYKISYKTPAPFKEENVSTHNGKFIKRVYIQSDASEHYNNVKSYTDLPEPSYSPKLFWYSGDQKLDVTNNSEFNVRFIDTNGNGYLDRVEWNVPQLSNQTFEVEADIEILNVQSFPTLGGNWTVRFDTLGIANLTITPINGTTFSEDPDDPLTEDDLEFLELKCGDNILTPQKIMDGIKLISIFYPNYSCDETGMEISKVLTSGKHTLKFQFGGVEAYAHNEVKFSNIIEPTDPSTYSSGASYQFNVTVADAGIEPSLVFIEFNDTTGTPTSLKNFTMSNETSEYYHTFTDLPAGTYFYRFYSNDTNDDWNSTSQYNWVLNDYITITENLNTSNVCINKDVKVSGKAILANASTGIGNTSIYIFQNETLIKFTCDDDLWNCGWNYRKPININENSGNSLTNYQVNLSIDTKTLISEGKMQPDCDDIRFTDDSSTELYYWVEGGCNTTSTVIWVNVNLSASQSNTIYVYYGNTTVTNISNGTNTFIFFDDFNDGSLDTSDRWTIGGGTPIESGGVLTLNAVGEYIYSQSSYGVNTSLRFRANFPDVESNWIGYISASSAPFAIVERYPTSKWGARSYVSSEVYSAYSTSILDSYHTYEISRDNGNSNKYYVDDNLNGTHSSQVTPNSLPLTIYMNVVDFPGLTTDWIALRNYVSLEPSSSTGSEEIPPSSTTNSTGHYNVSWTAPSTQGHYIIKVNITSSGIVGNNTTTLNVFLPPQFSNIIEPTDPSTYSSGASYQFNVTVADAGIEPSLVFIEFNDTTGTPTSLKNFTMSNETSEYYHTFTDLPAGTYFYRFYANVSDNSWNSTQQYTFTVSKARPAFILNNGTSSVNTSGLVGYWRFESFNSINETEDYSGYDNHGVGYKFNTDPASVVSGRFGNAVEFDGSDDYISTASSNSLGVGDELTLDAWINLNELDSDQYIFSSPNYKLYLNSSNNLICGVANDDSMISSWNYSIEMATVDKAYGVATDSSSNFIIVGDQGTNSGDWRIMKFNYSGYSLWNYTFDSGNGGDSAYGVAIDSSDNIIVAGRDRTSDYDWRIMKFNPSGSSLWNYTFDSGSGTDYAYGVAIDSSDNIIVVGWERATDYDWRIMKFNSSGDSLWNYTFDSGSGSDYAYGVAIDSSDNIIVAGYQILNGNDWRIMKFNPSGSSLWNYTFNSASTNSDRSYSVATDSSDNIIVAGSQGTNTNDWRIMKFNSSGDSLWNYTYDSGAGADNAYGVAIDSSDNIIVAGSQGTNSNDWRIMKFNPSGNSLWNFTYDCGLAVNEEAHGVATDPSDNIIMTGWQGTNSGDWRIMKFNINFTEVASSTALSSDTWHKLTCTYSSGNYLKSYVDGVLENTETSVPTTSSAVSNLNMGRSLDSSGFLNGTIDEVMVFNRALTGDEINMLYESRSDYGNGVTVTGTETNVTDSGQAITFTRNTTDIIGTENGTSTILNAGYHYYLINISSNQNYSSSALLIPYMVNKAKPVLVLDNGTSSVNTSGLVGYWRFESFNSINETEDYSGYGNDGVAYNFSTNPASVSGGRFGNAVEFDGNNDFINVSDSSSLAMTSEITVTSWFYVDEYESGAPIINRRNSSNVGGFTFELSGANNGMRFYIYNNSDDWKNAYSGDNEISTGKWYFTAGTYDGTSLKLYLDGVLKATTPASGTIGNPYNPEIWFGRNIASPTLYFNGTIDEVMVFNRALTEDEVRILYESRSDYGTGVTVTGIEADTTASLPTVTFTRNTTNIIGTENGTSTIIQGGYHYYFINASANQNYSSSALLIPYMVNKVKPVLVLNNGTSSVNTSGLVGYWRFEEGSGTSVQDFSGEGNNGTLIGGTSWVSGRFGNAVNFNSTNGTRTLISPDQSLNITGDYSIGAWIYPEGPNQWSTQEYIISKGWNYVFYRTAGTNQIALTFFNGTEWEGVFSSSSSALDNEWTHIFAVWNDSPRTGKIYINGVLNVTDTEVGEPNLGGYSIHIGGNPTSSNNNRTFNGTIDEVMIFNRALTGDEIYEFYQSATYGTQTTFTGTEIGQVDSDVTYSFFRNATDVKATENGTAQTLAQGYHYYLFNTSGGQNFTRSAILLPLDVSQINPPQFSNITEPTWPTTYYKGWLYYQFNVTVTGVDAEPSVVFIEFNDTAGTLTSLNNFTMSNDTSEYYYTFADLPAGTYFYRFYANDTNDDWNSTQQYNWTLGLATGSISIGPLQAIDYGTSAGVGCERVAGDSGSTLTFYRNGTEISQGTTSPQNDSTILAVGFYNYSCSMSATQNYSSAVLADKIFAVNRAKPILVLNNGTTSVNTSGLVGYWRFESFNSTNGTDDYSGYGNGGIAYDFNTDPAQITSGRFGNAVEFDGSDDYISIRRSSASGIANGLTLDAWVNLNELDSDQYILSSPNYRLYLNSSNNLICGVSNDSMASSWNYTFNSSIYNFDIAYGVAIDSSDNIIVVGAQASGSTWRIMKFNPSGSSLWNYTYDSNSGLDVAFDVATDSSDNIIVVGYQGTNSNDWRIMKFNPSGSSLWNYTYDSGSGSEYAEGVATDSSDNIIVVGYQGTNNDDWRIMKFNPSGSSLWNYTYDSGGSFEDWARGVAIDSSDNIIVTGQQSAVFQDWRIMKFNSSGDSLWNYSSSFLLTGSRDVAIDSSDNIVVIGLQPSSGYDWRIMKFNPSGDSLWTYSFNSAGTNEDTPNGITVDSSDNIIAVGAQGTNGNDFRIMKFNPSGDSLWNYTFDSGGSNADFALGIATDSLDNLIAVGYQTVSTDYDWRIMKFNINFTEVSSSAALSSDTWHKLTCTYSSGNYLKSYVDGVLENTETSVPTTSSAVSNLNMGRSLDSSGFLNGTIDEVMVFNRALTGDEIYEFYQSSVIYGTQTTFTGTEPESVDSDVTYNFFRNTTDVKATENGTAQAISQGYHYYLFNTSGGQNFTRSAILLPLNVLQNNPPQFSNIIEPTDQSIYSSDTPYQFNVTVTDLQTYPSLVYIEFNDTTGTLTSLNNFTMSNETSEYYHTFTDLPAGTYFYRFYANDTNDDWNSTSQYTFTINKAKPILILNNGTASVNTSGLVGYWRFESFNSTNGTDDYSGYDNHGVAYNFNTDPASVTAARFGNAVEFYNDFIDVDDAIDDVDVIRGAVSFWIKRNFTDSIYASPHAFVIYGDTDNRIKIMFFNTTNLWRFQYQAGATLQSIDLESANISKGVWTHVAITWDNTTDELKAYINGQQAGSTATGLGKWNNTITSFKLGSSSGGSNSLNGTMDEFMIFDRALTADEIRMLYESYGGSLFMSYSESNSIDDDITYNFFRNTSLIFSSETPPAGYSYYMVNTSGGQNFTRSALMIPARNDFIKSQFSNIIEPTDPSSYSPGASYQFNVTVDNNNGVSVVFIEFNDTTGTLTNLKNFTMSNETSEYYHTFTDLPAGTYFYRFYANNTVDDWNSTSQYTFTINKAKPILVLNNGTSSVNTSGLVGYWRFESFNSTNGTEDYSGYGNGGIAYKFNTDPAQITAARFGNAVDFDGADDYISISNSTPLGIEDEMTLDAWVNLNELNSDQYILSMADYKLYVDSSNNLVCGVANDDSMTSFWNYSFDSGYGFDAASGVATDSSGNFIVVGSQATNSYDWRIMKFNPSGSSLWNYTYNSGAGIDYAYEVATDSSDNFIVVGYQATNNNDWRIMKFNSSGYSLWTYTFDSGAGIDYAYGVATDTLDNNIVVGAQQTNGYDWRIMKFNSSGSSLWNYTFDSGGGNYDYAQAVATDSSDNIIVVGYQPTNGYDWRIMKFNPSGNSLWNYTYNSGAGYEYPNGVATDSSDNIIVVGIQGTNDGDWRIMKFSPSGDSLWNYTYSSLFEENTYGVATDSSDNIIVVGDRVINEEDYDWGIMKFNSSGSSLWNYTFDSGAGDDIAYGVATDTLDNNIVVGDQGTNGYDWRIMKFNINFTEVSSSTALSSDTWHKLTCTYSSGNYLKSYVDGALENTETSVPVASSALPNLNLGRSLNSFGFLNGTIDETMIFNRALTGDEIYELYQSRVASGGLTTFTGLEIGQVDSDLTYNFFRNTTDVKATENGTAQVISQGYHYYLFNTSGGQNFTRSAILLPLKVESIGISTSAKLTEGIFYAGLEAAQQNIQGDLNISIWNNATWNYNATDNKTEYWLRNDGETSLDFCMRANNHLTCNSGACTGNTIDAINIGWNNATSTNKLTPAYDTSKRMGLSFVKVAYGVAAGQTVYMRFWLDAEPSNNPSGIYNTTYSVKAVAAGASC